MQWDASAYICVCASEQLNEELKQNLRETMTQKYQQSTHEQITRAVDKLQQEVSVCITGWIDGRIQPPILENGGSFNLIFNTNSEMTTDIYFSQFNHTHSFSLTPNTQKKWMYLGGCLHPHRHIISEPELPSKSHMDSHVAC